MKKLILIFTVVICHFSHNNAQTVKDIDGNIYNTVSIGKQVWMKENLKVVRYNNGDSILTTYPRTLHIGGESEPKYQWPVLETDSQSKFYGRLYTGFVVTDNRKICPEGWHVPGYYEFKALIEYLGGDSLAQGKLKESGNLHWKNENKNANNSSGFTALPGGYRSYKDFMGLGNIGIWWTSTYLNPLNQNFIRLFENYSSMPIIYYDMRMLGHSVRCIKDSISTFNETFPILHPKIFPNPASDKLLISIEEAYLNTELEIFNPLGERVLRQSISCNSATIDISDLKAGVYFVSLSSKSGRFQQKFLKQ